MVAFLVCGAAPAAAQFARFGTERPSADALHVANWAVHSADHQAPPFVIVDKRDSRVFVFDGQGKLLGAARVVPTP